MPSLALIANNTRYIRLGKTSWRAYDAHGNDLGDKKWHDNEKNTREGGVQFYAKQLASIPFAHPLTLIVDCLIALTKLFQGQLSSLESSEAKQEWLVQVLQSLKNPIPISWTAIEWDARRVFFCAYKKAELEALVYSLEKLGIRIHRVWPGILLDAQELAMPYPDHLSLNVSAHALTVFYPRHHPVPCQIFHGGPLVSKLPSILASLKQQLPELRWQVRVMPDAEIDESAFQDCPVDQFHKAVRLKVDCPWNLKPASRFGIQSFWHRLYAHRGMCHKILAIGLSAYVATAGLGLLAEKHYLQSKLNAFEGSFNERFPQWEKVKNSPLYFVNLIEKDLWAVAKDMKNCFQSHPGFAIESMEFQKKVQFKAMLKCIKGSRLRLEGDVSSEKDASAWEEGFWPERMVVQPEERAWHFHTPLTDNQNP
jgi:hypothetical protein